MSGPGHHFTQSYSIQGTECDCTLWLQKGEVIGLSPKNTQLGGGFFYNQKLEDKKELWRGMRKQGDRPKG